VRQKLSKKPATVERGELPSGNWKFDIVALEDGIKLTKSIAKPLCPES